MSSRSKSFLGSLDWWSVGLCILLMILGWFSICGASFVENDANIFSLSTRTGMQIVWIVTALCLAGVIMLTNVTHLDTFAFAIYTFIMLLLFATIFNPHSIKGSHSWLVLGPLRLQPAEFGKFATSLAVAKLMSTYSFNIKNNRNLFLAIGVILLPMLFIIGQRETGSALVYLSLFLMLYREGMPGSILFVGVSMVLYFVIGVKYEDVQLSITPTSVGKYSVLLLIQIFSCMMAYIYCKEKKQILNTMGTALTITLLTTLFALYVIPFDLSKALLAIDICIIGWLIYQFFYTHVSKYLLITIFTLGSLTFFYSADYVLNNVMQPHQRTRINVLLGLEEDLAGAGYNVHQSEIAIGSGGFLGKGFCNGTQTKLKFVPEQDTDFIFCTIGEEQGFVGSSIVLLLFLTLILRLIYLAERQPFTFGRVYGYCVVSILIFHLFINVGMVLGLTPVIGIPLPFFSYGGSSLWGFTLLITIFLRIDANRNNRLLA